MVRPAGLRGTGMVVGEGEAKTPGECQVLLLELELDER